MKSVLAIAALVASQAGLTQPGGPLHYDREKEQAFWTAHPCGDHSIIAGTTARSVLDRHCRREARNEESTKVVRALSARRDADFSLARGDYRVAAMWPDFPPRPGLSPWETPGVACDTIRRDDLVVFSAFWDTATPSRHVLEEAISKFLSEYNSRLVADHRFPKSLGCKPALKKGIEQ